MGCWMSSYCCLPTGRGGSRHRRKCYSECSAKGSVQGLFGNSCYGLGVSLEDNHDPNLPQPQGHARWRRPSLSSEQLLCILEQVRPGGLVVDFRELGSRRSFSPAVQKSSSIGLSKAGVFARVVVVFPLMVSCLSQSWRKETRAQI